jgi:hypothetical protein
MDIHEAKLGDGEVQDIEDFTIDLGLVRGLSCGIESFSCGATLRVEIVDKLTEYNTQKRKGDTRRNGAQDSTDEQ